MKQSADTPADKSSAALSRRQFLKVAGTLLGGAAASSVLLESGRSFIAGLAARTATAADPSGHYWGFVVDVTKCIGCGRCVVACKRENNVPLHPECNRTWVERYRVRADGEILVDSPEGGIHGFASVTGASGTENESAPEEIGVLPSHPKLPEPAGNGDSAEAEGDIVRGFFVPKLCNQCQNPPCVQVCPVGATYKTKDGVVLVDQDRCIGCRYCIQACPYGARYLLPDVRTTPTGQVHVVDKCTWCYHRINNGRDPACVEVCPVGARSFGDLNDPDSDVSRILKERQVAVLKPDLGTKPKVYYLGLGEGVR